MSTRNKPFSAATWARKANTSAMFSVHFVDGRTEYFVLHNQAKSTCEEAALRAAYERQQTGELSNGCIATIKRAR